MRNPIGRTAAFFVTSGFAAALFVAGAADGATMNMYLSAGQSNELGPAGVAYTPAPADKKVLFSYEIGSSDEKQIDLRRWEAPATKQPHLPRWLQQTDLGPFALMPQAYGKEGPRTGPEIAFGRKISLHFGGASQKTVIVKFAVGESRLDGEWLHSDSVDLADEMIIFFSRVKAFYEAQGNTVLIKAYRHNQGESDTASMVFANRYYENLQAVIAKVRNWAGNPTLPVVISRIHANYSALSPGKASRLQPAVDAVRRAQEQFVATDSCAALVNTDDLAQNGVWHYRDPYALGNKSYSAVLPMISGRACYNGSLPGRSH